MMRVNFERRGERAAPLQTTMVSYNSNKNFDAITLTDDAILGIIG